MFNFDLKHILVGQMVLIFIAVIVVLTRPRAAWFPRVVGLSKEKTAIVYKSALILGFFLAMLLGLAIASYI